MHAIESTRSSKRTDGGGKPNIHGFNANGGNSNNLSASANTERHRILLK